MNAGEPGALPRDSLDRRDAIRVGEKQMRDVETEGALGPASCRQMRKRGRFRSTVPELTFESITNDRERDLFNDVPTSFSLPDQTVDRLIEAGEFGGRLRPGSGTVSLKGKTIPGRIGIVRLFTETFTVEDA
jgi:hypothetical protein